MASLSRTNPIFRKFAYSLQYKLWEISCNKFNVKRRAKSATKRGDFKEALKFWDLALRFFPLDPELLINRQTCVNFLSNPNAVDYKKQEELLNKISKFLEKKLYKEALELWHELNLQNTLQSPKFHNVSGDIFKQIIYNSLEFQNKEIEASLLKSLYYSDPGLLAITGGYSSIVKTLIRHKRTDPEIYNRFIFYTKKLITENNLQSDYNVSSACVAISFDLVDRNEKEKLLDKFFSDFSKYNQWGIVLHADNLENIEIFQNKLAEFSQKIEDKTPKEIFTILYIASAISPQIYQEVQEKIKKLPFCFDRNLPFVSDLEYIAERKNLYQETVKEYGLESIFPKAEFSSRTNKKLKIAVCVSGQLRGYKKAFASWKNFGAGDHDVSYFVHSWKNVGRKYPNPPSDERSLSGKFLQEWRNAWFKLEEQEMNRRYKNIFKIFSDGDVVTEEQLKNFYNAKEVVLEDDKSIHFANFTNSKKMYYKVYECHKLARKYGDFDLIIRIRPDRELHIQNQIDWNEIYHQLSTKKTIIVDSGPGLHPGSEYVIGDQMAIGTNNIMDCYAMTYKTVEYAKNLDLSAMPKDYRPHTNLSYNLLYHNILIKNPKNFDKKLFKYGDLLDPEPLTTKEVFDAIVKDVKNSQDRIDLALLEAAKYDFQTTT